MFSLIIAWVLNALALLLVSYLIPGFRVRSFGAALLAALIIGLLNIVLGPALTLLTLPITLLTLGLFLFVLNALLLKLAAAIVPDFAIDGWGPALLAAIVLALLNVALPGIVTL